MLEHDTLDESRLMVIATAIEAIGRRTGFERRNEMGQIIFEQVFRRDREACLLPSSPRQISFRKLAELLHGKISKSELHRSLRVHLLCQELPFVPTSGHLTVSHADAVLGLASSLQEQLLRAAEDQKLSVRQLRQLRRNLMAAPQRSEGEGELYVATLARRVSRRGLRTAEAFAVLARRLVRDVPNLPSSDIADLLAAVEKLQSTCLQVRDSLASSRLSRDHAA